MSTDHPNSTRTLWFLKTFAAILSTYEFDDETYQSFFNDPHLWDAFEVLQHSPDASTYTTCLLILQEWHRTQ
jgi:hypothetical protein